MSYILAGTILFFISGLFSVFIKEKFKGIGFLSFAVLAQVFILPVTLRTLLTGSYNRGAGVWDRNSVANCSWH